MKPKTKILNQIRRVGMMPPVEHALATLAQNKTVGSIFANIAPNNYQYPPNTMREVTRNGIRYRLDISDYMQYCIYFGIEIEPRHRLYGLVENGTTVIDVGTNIGETLLNFAKLNGDGRNIGFEPVPHLYEKARTNIELNDLGNIELINKGLGSSEETLSFRESSENNSGGTFLTRENGADGRSVDVVTLDDFVSKNEVKDISLIKIDVEGFEMEVLKGASQVLQDLKPMLFVEIDDSFLARQQSSANAVFDLLTLHGYRIENALSGEGVNSGSAISGKHLDIIAKPIT